MLVVATNHLWWKQANHDKWHWTACCVVLILSIGFVMNPLQQRCLTSSNDADWSGHNYFRWVCLMTVIKYGQSICFARYFLLKNKKNENRRKYQVEAHAHLRKNVPTFFTVHLECHQFNLWFGFVLLIQLWAKIRQISIFKVCKYFLSLNVWSSYQSYVAWYAT